MSFIKKIYYYFVKIKPAKPVQSKKIFDYVVNHLRTQGPAFNVKGGAKYRSEDGKKCAIGCLISDKEYSETFERSGQLTGLLFRNLHTPDSLKQKLLPHFNLLGKLQSIHDHTPQAIWEKEFEKLEALLPHIEDDSAFRIAAIRIFGANEKNCPWYNQYKNVAKL